MELNGKKIAILATHGFEQAELEVPLDQLRKSGAVVDVISLSPGQIKGWETKDWGRPVKVDKTIDQVSASDYDAIVLPGGQINPDLLRVEPTALKLIRDFYDAQKVVAAICHGWTLAVNRNRHRQGSQDDILQVDQDRPDQCRCKMGGHGGGGGSRHHHIAQSRRSRRFQQKNRGRNPRRATQPRGVMVHRTVGACKVAENSRVSCLGRIVGQCSDATTAVSDRYRLLC